MANLVVSAKLDKGASDPFVAIDGNISRLTPKGSGVFEGTCTVPGTCGDGSSHCLLFSWSGPVGATMAAEVKCGGTSVAKSGPLAISAAGVPYGGNRRYFRI